MVAWISDELLSYLQAVHSESDFIAIFKSRGEVTRQVVERYLQL